MKLERMENRRPLILNWAEQVKLRMAEQGWNIKRFAEELGKSPQFLSQLLSAYTHGQRRPTMPSYEIVEVIDKKLGLSREQQYQLLGITSSNQIGLGSSLSSDNELVQIMQDSHSEYERHLLEDPEQRFSQLEAQVRLLARRLDVDLSELTETR